jgi:DNA-binding response OmpR family regulator
VRRPSLVILDLALEGGSGLDLLDRVRHADGLASRIDPDLPVIVLSGRVAEADRVRSFARGADDHVCKPTRSLFFSVVEPHLRLNAARRVSPPANRAQDCSLCRRLSRKASRRFWRDQVSRGAPAAGLAWPGGFRPR